MALGAFNGALAKPHDQEPQGYLDPPTDRFAHPRCQPHMSRFGECFDECHLPSKCRSECHEDYSRSSCDELGHEDCVHSDKSSIQTTYNEVLKSARQAGDLAHRGDDRSAIEAYGSAIHCIKKIESWNCHGIAQYNPQIDIHMTCVTFTILVNTAACFLRYQGWDDVEAAEGQVKRSRFEEALECTKAALEMVQDCQHQQQVDCWTPSARELATLHKISAAAFQALGKHEETFVHARYVLDYSPSDAIIRKYLDRQPAKLTTPLDARLLSEKLEKVQKEDEGPCWVHDESGYGVKATESTKFCDLHSAMGIAYD